MQNTDHHPVCDLSGEIVSYLYNEIEPGEKLAFEKHLAKCRFCAGELAAFSEVHTVLGDWRENVFAPLDTPEINIPYSPVPARPAGLEEASPSSWLDRFRAGFGFSFAWPAVASILLMICATALFFSFSTPRQNEIAAGVSPQAIPERVTDAPETGAPSNEITDSVWLPSEVKSPARAAKSSKDKETNAIAVRQLVVSRKTATGRNIDLPVRNVSAVRIKPSAETVAVNQTKSLKSGSLLGDDEENKDDSLRLSELFDENDEEN